MTADEKVSKYIRRAIEIMEINDPSGKRLSELQSVPEDVGRFLMPMIIEVAKMIQLEEIHHPMGGPNPR